MEDPLFQTCKSSESRDPFTLEEEGKQFSCVAPLAVLVKGY